MTHVEFPEALMLAHQILQLLLKIQPGDQPHRMRGRGLRDAPPQPGSGRGLHAETWGSSPMLLTLLGAPLPP